MTTKRKLPDFLTGIEWNKRKSQKWLKNYPYLRCNLNQLSRNYTQTNERIKLVTSWFKRLSWFISISKMNVCSSVIFKSAAISFHYISTTIVPCLIKIKSDMDLFEIRISEMYVLVQGNKPINDEDIKEIISSMENKLINIRFYCDKFIVILKDLELFVNSSFEPKSILIAPILKTTVIYKPISDEKDFNKIKKQLKFDFYLENPETLLLDYGHQKEISNRCFFNYLEIATEVEYLCTLQKHIDLLISFHIKIFENVKIKHFSNAVLYLSNGQEFYLVQRFTHRFKTSKSIVFSYLFFLSGKNIFISIPTTFPNLGNFKLPDVLIGIILDYSLNIRIIDKNDLELID